MQFNHKTITSSGDSELSLSAAEAEAYHGQVRTIERLLICNTDSTEITVDLWLDDGTNEFMMLDGTSIPVGVTLDFLNGIPFAYDAKYSVKVKLGNSGYTADIIYNEY